VAHGYLPPHPSPAAIAGQLNAKIGLTLAYGILVSIPAIVIAGPIFGKTLGKYQPKIDRELFNIKEVPTTDLPGTGISFLVALLPVVLLTVFGPLKTYLLTAPEGQTPLLDKTSLAGKLVTLIAEPYMGMLLSVLLAIWVLGLRRRADGTRPTMKSVMKELEEAIKAASPILLVIAGAGGLKQVFADSGTSAYIGTLLTGVSIPPLILGWGMAGLIRICVGSATVAGLTTVGIILPLIQAQSVNPELMVLAIGSGSLMCSHINDGGFWLFKEYFNLSIPETLRTWTVMETIVSIVGLAGVLLLNTIIG
jgi:gluconate transporter